MSLWARPGGRWGLVALVIVGAVINYLSRNALAVLAPQLERTLHFGAREYSYVIGAFQVAYTTMQPVCGWVIDRIGVRTGFALFAALWSMAGLLHAGVASWPMLAGVRALLGVSEAAAIPAGVKVIGERFRDPSRSAAMGWLNAGTSFGAALAPPLTGALVLLYGWRAPFVVIAGLGFAWAALWVSVYRSPSDVAERAPRGSAGPILSTRRFRALAVPRFLMEPAWQTFSFWIPLYLHDERGWDLKAVALFAWAPFLAADLGGLVGGYVSPLLMRWTGAALIPSRLLTMALGAVLMIAPGCTALAGSPALALALLCVGGFAHQILSTTVNTLCADLFAPAGLATANGWLGAAGWTGGLLFSLLIGQVVGRTGFGPLFACLSVFDLVGLAAAAVMLRGERPLAVHTVPA